MSPARITVRHFHVRRTDADAESTSGGTTGPLLTGLSLPVPPPCPFYGFSLVLGLFTGFL